MTFGLTNAPPTWQTMIQQVLKGIKRVYVYLNDILMVAMTEEEHLEQIRQVLTQLRENTLFAKFGKCDFWKTETEYLGHLVNTEGVKTHPRITQAVEKFAVPKTVTEIRWFTGLTGYYRWFIKNYAQIATPLTNLTQKERKFEWTTECKTTFERQFDFSAPARITSDASDVAYSAVLEQKRPNWWQPVAYMSKKWEPGQAKYVVPMKELCGFIYALKEWRHYLLGREITVQTDHQSLVHIQTQPHLIEVQARWVQTLAEYNVTVKYIPGVKNLVANALSRMVPILVAPKIVKILSIWESI